jgi:hypothetical protein
MRFDILGYRDKYKSHFGDAPLEEVAKFAYEKGGFAQDQDFDTWKKSYGVESVLQDEIKKKRVALEPSVAHTVGASGASIVPAAIKGIGGVLQATEELSPKGMATGGTSLLSMAIGKPLELAGIPQVKKGIDFITETMESSKHPLSDVSIAKTIEQKLGMEKTLGSHVSQAGKALDEVIRPEGLEQGSWKAQLYGGASSAADNLSKIAVAIYKKKPQLVLPIMAIQSGATDYAEKREAGMTPGVALGAGVLNAATEYVTEKIPLGFLMDKKSGLAKRILGSIASEIPGELIATTVEQGLIDTSTTNPNKTWEEFKTDLVDTAIQTAIATPLLAGGSHSVIKWAEKTENRMQSESIQASIRNNGHTQLPDTDLKNILSISKDLERLLPKDEGLKSSVLKIEEEMSNRGLSVSEEDINKVTNLRKVASLSNDIDFGLKTGMLYEKPFDPDKAIELIKIGQQDGIYTEEDLDGLKIRHPQLKDKLNDLISDNIATKIDNTLAEATGTAVTEPTPIVSETIEAEKPVENKIEAISQPKPIADYTKETDNHIKFLAETNDAQAIKEAQRRGFEVSGLINETTREVTIPKTGETKSAITSPIVETTTSEVPSTEGIHPNLQKALQRPLRISESSATQIKIATKETITEKYEAGEIKEGTPIRFTSVDELRNVITKGELPVGSDFEGHPGISAQTMSKDTMLVAYGPNNKVSAAIIFPEDAVAGKGVQANEVLMKAETPLEKLRFVIGGHKELLTFDQLKEVYKGDTIAQAIKEKPTPTTEVSTTGTSTVETTPTSTTKTTKTAVPKTLQASKTGTVESAKAAVPTTHKTFKDYAIASGYVYPETVDKAKSPLTAFYRANLTKLKTNGLTAKQLAQKFRDDQGVVKTETKPTKTLKVKLVPKTETKKIESKSAEKKPEPKSNVTTLITKPMKDFHKTLQSEISEGVKNIQAKVAEYKGWKWEVGDRVKSHKTGKMWEIIGKTWNNQKNIPMYIMKNEADEEKSHFYAEPTKIRDMDIPSVYDGFTKLGTKPEVLKGGKTEVKPTEVKAAEKAVLPANLAKARPRYSYGEKKFTLKFDNDLDKAAYISAQKTKSKFDQDYVNHVMEKAKLTEADVREHGKTIKESIKALAKDAADGTEIQVPKSNIPQFKSTQQAQTNLPPISLKEVKTMFKDQEVIQPGGPNAPIYVKTRGGQYLLVETVTEITPNKLAFKISYGRDYDPKIDHLVGAYESGTVTLVRGTTGQFELDHESIHWMEDVGIIDSHEVGLLKRHITDLVKAGQFVTVNVEDVGGPEDRANFIAQELGKGKSEGLLNRIMDRIRDFIDGLANAFGKRTVPGVIRDIQSGKIFEREGDLQKNNPALYALQQKLKPFFSQFENVVTKKMGGKMPVDQLIKMLKSNGVTDAEIDQIIISDLSDDKKIFTRQEVMDAITANTTEFKDDIFGNPNEYQTLLADERNAAKEYLMGPDVETFVANIAMSTDLDLVRKDVNRVWAQNNADIISLAQSYGYEPSSEFMNTDEPGKYAQYEQFSEPGYVSGSYRELFVTAPAVVITPSKDDLALLDRLDNNDKTLTPAEKDRLKVLVRGTNAEGGMYPRWSDGHSNYSSVNNPIVRIRYNDRMIDGKKILFIEEMQGPSDQNQDKMPEMFRKRIYDIGVKRVLALAKEGRYGGIAWTTGQMQADRYDLSKHLDTVSVRKETEGTYSIFGMKDGKTVVDTRGVKQEDLANNIGKDLALKVDHDIYRTQEDITQRNEALKQKSKLDQEIYNLEVNPTGNQKQIDAKKFDLNQVNLKLERLMPRVTYSGLDLKVGGEGLKTLYDKTLPSMFKKYGKESISTTELKPGIKWTEDNELWFTKVGPVTYHIYRESNSEFVLAEGEYGSEEYKEYGTFDTLTEAKTEAEKIIKPSTQILLVTNSDMGYDILKDIRREEDLTGGEDSLLEDLQDSYNVDTVHSITDLDPAVIPILEKYAPGVFIRNNEISGQVKIDYQNLGDDGYDQVVNELEMITEKVDQDLDYQPLLDILYDFQHGVQVFSGRDAELLTKYMPDMITPVTVENQKVSMIPITDKTPASYPQYAVQRRTSPPVPQILPWDVDPPSRIDKLLRVFADRFVDLRKVIKAIETVHGELQDADDPSLQQILYSAKVRNGIDLFLRDELRPLLRDLEIEHMTLESFHNYILNRHAPEANAYIASINPNMQDGGSGVLTQDAIDYMANLSPRDKRIFEAAAQKYDAIARKNLQLLVDNGLESQKTIDTWLDKYEYYAPLYRADMEKNGGMGTGRGFTVVGGASKARHGSTRTVENVISSISEQRERYLTRIHKNNIDKALVTLVDTFPNPDFWKLARPGITERVSADPAQRGQMVKVVNMDYMYKDNVIMARTIDPKTGDVVQRGVEFNLENDRAAETVKALKNLDMDKLGAVLSISAKITRFISSMNTQYNIVFGIVNFVRDFQSAMLNLTSTELAGKQLEIAKGVFPALRTIYSDLRSEHMGHVSHNTRQIDQDWADFRAHGGMVGYMDMYKTRKDRLDAIKEEMSRSTKGMSKQLFHQVASWLSDYNTTIESGIRFSAYKVALQNGFTKDRAAALAKNLTLDFNKKGTISMQAGSLFAFFNATAQGAVRLTETLAGPAGGKIIAGGIMLGVIQALALAAADFKDDEPPEFVKERGFIIPTGGGKYFAIPMPLGFHILPNIGRISTEWAMSGFKKSMPRFANLFGLLVEAFNPMGTSGMSVQTITPTPLDSIIALAENKDWTGRSIYKDNFNPLQPTPGFSRAKDSATGVSYGISWALNRLSGGSQYKPGIFSPTPDQIDYLAGQVGGGVVREGIKVGQAIMNIGSKEPLPTHKIPVVSRFYGSIDSDMQVRTRYYDILKTMNEHDLEIKGLAKAGKSAYSYIQENPEARFVAMAKQTDTNIRKLTTEKRELEDQNISKDVIKRIDNVILANMKRLNEQYKLSK